MNICHLATKTFDTVNARRSIVWDDKVYLLGQTYTDNNRREEVIQFSKDLPADFNGIASLDAGKTSLINSPIGGIVADNNANLLPLSCIFNYRVKAGDTLSAYLQPDTPFEPIFEAEDIQGYLADLAVTLFPSDTDINPKSVYTPYIPLATLTGCVPPQLGDGIAYFNPKGTVTIAEFLDSLNAIAYGSNSNRHRKKTLDSISSEGDYFNEGYQSCLRGMSSPFFGLYKRSELLRPITRLELAYITVLCWTPFIERFNNLYSYYLGISFDWEYPSEVLEKYKDGFDYKVSRIVSDTTYSIVSLNVNEYRGDRLIEALLGDIKYGSSAIPLPMFMSLVELGVLKFFNFDNNELSPLKEVSREELSYFITKIACHFQTPYRI